MVMLPDKPMQTVDAIWAAYEARQDTSHRRHLGGSVIGKSCERELWYSFRWASVTRFSGRLLRLFQTGHLAETRFVRDLRSIGVTVQDVDPETGRQWHLQDETGHAGGSMDAVAWGFLEAPQTDHGVEFKTHSEKSFTALEKDGVLASKPLHWAQMQIYMHWSGLTRFFYLAVNKNTDALYQERVRADPAEGLKLEAKAARIIKAARPPARISNDAGWYECRLCDQRGVCWEGVRPARHCRSCLHSTPVAKGDWHCAKHNGIIPRDFEKDGCEDHLYIPDFIDGEVTDASEHGVVYKLSDGTLYTDGVPF